MSLRLMLAAGFCLTPAFALLADEPATPPAAPATESSAEVVPAEPAAAPTADEIAELIKKFDSRKFAERQDASTKLRGAGKAAIPALTEVATSGSREASVRAIEILKSHFADGHPDAKQAAKEALEAIAKSDSPMAAQEAQNALRPKEEFAQQNPFAPQRGVIVINGNNIRLAAQPIQIQIQAQAIGGPGQRVQIRNANGVKDIEAEENGRKVKIHEEPTGKIQIEITETKDGKPVTEKFEAKNADELKKNHPDAHKAYEKYNQGGFGAPQIQIQAVPGNALPIQPGQIQRIQLQPGARNFRAAAPLNPEDQKKLSDASAKMKDALRRFGQAMEDTKDPESAEAKKARAELEAAQKEYAEVRKSLLPAPQFLPVAPAIPVPAGDPAQPLPPLNPQPAPLNPEDQKKIDDARAKVEEAAKEFAQKVGETKNIQSPEAQNARAALEKAQQEFIELLTKLRPAPQFAPIAPPIRVAPMPFPPALPALPPGFAPAEVPAIPLPLIPAEALPAEILPVEPPPAIEGEIEIELK